MNWVKKDENRLITPVFTAAFASVFEPTKIKGQPESKKKYRLTMIFPKGQDFAPLEKMIQEVAYKKWGEKATAILKKQADSDKRLFKDGSNMVAQNYAGFIDGAIYIQANSSEKAKPRVSEKREGLLYDLKTEEEFYSGCKAIASISPYALDEVVAKGVFFSLVNVLKISDGERLGGSRAKPEQDFDAPMAEESLESLFG